jgi:hypothetical protein
VNVNDLIEELDGYGGHLVVQIEIPASGDAGTLQKRDDDSYYDVAVDLTMVDGMQTLTIAPVVP